jgi:hypothetical protein
LNDRQREAAARTKKATKAKKENSKTVQASLKVGGDSLAYWEEAHPGIQAHEGFRRAWDKYTQFKLEQRDPIGAYPITSFKEAITLATQNVKEKAGSATPEDLIIAINHTISRNYHRLGIFHPGKTPSRPGNNGDILLDSSECKSKIRQGRGGEFIPVIPHEGKRYSSGTIMNQEVRNH